MTERLLEEIKCNGIKFVVKTLEDQNAGLTRQIKYNKDMISEVYKSCRHEFESVHISDNDYMYTCKICDYSYIME